MTQREMKFRKEIKNPKGLRPIPIDLSNGKTYDWAMLSRQEKQAMKKALRKYPKILRKIELAKKVKIYDEPMQENVYFCDKCNKVHLVHEIDPGTCPVFITCFNCSYPQARSLGYKIPDSYRQKLPDIIMRYPTEEEYEAAPDEMKGYLEQGGLFMEKVK